MSRIADRYKILLIWMKMYADILMVSRNLLNTIGAVIPHENEFIVRSINQHRFIW